MLIERRERFVSSVPLVPFLALALLVAASGCEESNIDAGEITEALAEEFTDGIEFDNETIEDGAPPESDVDEPFVRGIEVPNNIAPAALNVPDSVEFDTWFDVVLDTYSTPLDDGSVQGFIAHVIQADYDDTAARYHLVTPDAADFDGSRVTLRAVVHPVAEFGGHAFTVRIAPLLSDGSVAPYIYWNLVVHVPAGQTPPKPMCGCDEVVVHDEQIGYDLLVETNADLGQTCTDEILNAYFSGIEGYDAGPCSYLMPSYYFDNPMEEFTFPDGTRFPPNNRPRLDDPWACTMEISCQ